MKPTAFPEHELIRLRDQIVSNIEWAWEITGRSEDERTGVMLQISQVVARELKAGERRLRSLGCYHFAANLSRSDLIQHDLRVVASAFGPLFRRLQSSWVGLR